MSVKDGRTFLERISDVFSRYFDIDFSGVEIIEEWSDCWFRANDIIDALNRGRMSVNKAPLDRSVFGAISLGSLRDSRYFTKTRNGWAMDCRPFGYPECEYMSCWGVMAAAVLSGGNPCLNGDLLNLCLEEINGGKDKNNG